MKHLMIALAASAILMTSAMAQKIGVTLSAFEHQFLVKVREAMEEKAKELGVKIQFVEAQGDIGKQLNPHGTNPRFRPGNASWLHPILCGTREYDSH